VVRLSISPLPDTAQDPVFDRPLAAGSPSGASISAST
jgi:hypothetical protein